MSKDEKFAKDIKALATIIFGILAVFFIAKYLLDKGLEEERIEKFTHFQKGKELICGLGKSSKSNKGYIVSQNNG